MAKFENVYFALLSVIFAKAAKRMYPNTNYKYDEEFVVKSRTVL